MTLEKFLLPSEKKIIHKLSDLQKEIIERRESIKRAIIGTRIGKGSSSKKVKINHNLFQNILKEEGILENINNDTTYLDNIDNNINIAIYLKKYKEIKKEIYDFANEVNLIIEIGKIDLEKIKIFDIELNTLIDKMEIIYHDDLLGYDISDKLEFLITNSESLKKILEQSKIDMAKYFSNEDLILEILEKLIKKTIINKRK